MHHMELVKVRLPVTFVMHLHNIYQIINHNYYDFIVLHINYLCRMLMCVIRGIVSKMECHQGEGMSLAELRSHTVMGCDLHIATAVSS